MPSAEQVAYWSTYYRVQFS